MKSSDGKLIGRNLTKKERASPEDPSISVMTSLYLSADDLQALGELKGAVIEKRRYFRENAESRTTFDVFGGNHVGLIIAEVEFLDEASRDRFQPPIDWIEVTGVQRYSCGYLAFKGGY